MVRLVQCLGIGSFIGAIPVALQNALLDTSRRASSTGCRLTRTCGLVRAGPLRIKRRGVEMGLIIEGLSAVPRNADPVLLKEIRRAHRCFEALASGQVRSVAELATVEGISDRYVSSLLPLAFLAPDIVEAIAAGRQPPDLTAHRVIRTVDLPIARAAQKQVLGLRSPN